MEKLENGCKVDEDEDAEVILHYNPSIMLQHKWYVALSVILEKI